MIVATRTTLLWDADGMLPAAGGCVYVVGGKSLYLLLSVAVNQALL